jgi:hypothetical protein
MLTSETGSAIRPPFCSDSPTGFPMISVGGDCSEACGKLLVRTFERLIAVGCQTDAGLIYTLVVSFPPRRLQ